MPDNDRIAVVTGGGRGIGRGIVLELARSGFTVVVNYQRDQSSAELTCRDAERLGAPRTLALQADVCELEAGTTLVSHVMEAFGGINLWVNNAGVAPETRRDVLDTTPESWDTVLNTNLRGTFFLTQIVARALIQQKENGSTRQPQIVFITSVSSTFVSLQRGEYCVSKAGLSMVAKLFATRLAEHGILVYEVRPGIIGTDMTGPVRELYDKRIREGLTPIRRWGDPADVGKVVVALATGALPFSTGEVIHVDGGLQIPRL